MGWKSGRDATELHKCEQSSSLAKCAQHIRTLFFACARQRAAEIVSVKKSVKPRPQSRGCKRSTGRSLSYWDHSRCFVGRYRICRCFVVMFDSNLRKML